MGNNSDTNVIDLKPEAKDDDSGSSGWDPYIFSIFSKRKKPPPVERRLKPRTPDASRRRALLLAKARRQK
jgi:hypothetical protein